MTTSENQPVSARFGMTRENFILDPVLDTRCFARDDIPIQQIAHGLDIDVVTGLAPKRLISGPYGAGKTHTLMRTMDELAKLAKIHPIRIECPDLAKRSRFHDLYREGIMRTMGQDFVLGLMEEVVQKIGFRNRDVLRLELKKWFRDEEIAKAAEQLYNPNFDRLKLWRWISGVGLSRGDLDLLGQTQDLTETEAARLADILIMLGRLLRELRQQSLVLILDEMERLKSIGPETITTFMSGFTRLVDPNQTSVCILIGASAALESEMVDIFSGASPVTSRLGKDSMIDIPALHDPDVNRFIERVTEYVRDQKFDVSQAISEAAKDTDEKLTKETFPFSAEAMEALKSKTQLLTPREITLQMTRALGRAHRLQKSVITSDCVV
jgi:Cdc6-like AAA superfamily ATPase